MKLLVFLIIYVVGAALVALILSAEFFMFNNKTARVMTKDQLKGLALLAILWPVTVPRILVAIVSGNL